MTPAQFAKAIYAAVMAALLAAQAVYVDNVVLTIVIAALIPIGTYLIPNSPATPDTEGRAPII